VEDKERQREGSSTSGEEAERPTATTGERALVNDGEQLSEFIGWSGSELVNSVVLPMQ